MPDAFTLRIELGNDAMQTAQDIAEALRDTAVRIGYGAVIGTTETGRIHDANGNEVGQWSIAP